MQLRGLGGEECVPDVSASALAGKLWIRYVIKLTFSMDCHCSTGRRAAHSAVFRGKCWSSPTLPADQTQSHPCKPYARWNTSGRLLCFCALLYSPVNPWYKCIAMTMTVNYTCNTRYTPHAIRSPSVGSRERFHDAPCAPKSQSYAIVVPGCSTSPLASSRPSAYHLHSLAILLWSLCSGKANLLMSTSTWMVQWTGRITFLSVVEHS